MLTYESLIEQAKLREMPHTKIRGILREYLQILILKEIYRDEAGKRLYFTGGTYLRLVHNLKRFSEDLDFNIDKMRQKEFEKLLLKVGNELKRVGLEVKVQFAHWQKVLVSKLTFSNVEERYNVISRYSKKEGIVIKIESNRPTWKIESETQTISGFGEFYPCICTDRSALFADKIDALIKKDRARHLYDIMFMLSNKHPINERILKGFGITEDPLKVIYDRVKGLSKRELKKQAETLKPFLFDENEADLIVKAQELMPTLLEKYR